MRKLLGYLTGLGLFGFGIVAFVGQMNVFERSANSDDFYAALVMGGLLAFAGVVTLIAVARSGRGKKADRSGAEAAIWGVGMATLGDEADGSDFDGD